MFSLNFPSRRKSALVAFTLIELAIVLGVVGVVGGGLWRLMSSSGQQTKDAATASQQGALINAVKGYLSSTEGQIWMGSLPTNTAISSNPTNLPLPTSNTSIANCKANAAMVNNPGFCDFLPANFTSAAAATPTTNPYGQTYAIHVLKDYTPNPTPPVTYSFMIIASGGPLPIPDANGGRISNLIGGDGGFIYSTTVCSATAALAPTTVCGALGAWQDITGTYGFGAYTGAVASRTFVSATSNSSLQWLSRIYDTDANHTLNTMTADIIMGTWLGAATTPLSTTMTAAPSIHLQNGMINGDGLAASNTAAGQIALTRTDSATNTNLIYLTTKCTSLTPTYTLNPPAIDPCPTALDIGEGDVFVGGSVTASKIYSASDARLKTDIHPITDGLANVMKLDAVSFTFKAGGKPSLGVIAQDLEKVYPQLVMERDGTKFVEYTGLIAPLISAVQELKHQNDDLREQLARQAARQEKLERQLKLKSAAP